MKFSHGSNVTLKNDFTDQSGNTIPAGTGGVVLSGKIIGAHTFYSVSFQTFGLEIVEEDDLN